MNGILQWDGSVDWWRQGFSSIRIHRPSLIWVLLGYGGTGAPEEHPTLPDLPPHTTSPQHSLFESAQHFHWPSPPQKLPSSGINFKLPCSIPLQCRPVRSKDHSWHKRPSRSQATDCIPLWLKGPDTLPQISNILSFYFLRHPFRCF